MANTNFTSILLEATIEKLSIDELVRFWNVIMVATPTISDGELYIQDKQHRSNIKDILSVLEDERKDALWEQIMSFPNRYFVIDSCCNCTPLSEDMIGGNFVRKYWDDIFPTIVQNPRKLDEIKYFSNVYYPCMIEGVKPKLDKTTERTKFLSKAAALVMDVNNYVANKLHWHNPQCKCFFYNDNLHVWCVPTDLDLERMFTLIWQHHFNDGEETFDTPKTIEWQVYYCHGLLGNANLGFSIGYKNGEIFVEYPSQNHQFFPNC